MKPRAFVATAVAVVVCLLAAPASAENLRVVPSISLEGVWDSNIFAASTDEQSDIILRATPGLGLYFDAFQTTTVISGRFGFEWYQDNKELEDNPSTIDLRLSAAEPMQITPRFSLSPYVGFLETQDSWRRTLLISPPTPDVPPTDQIVAVRAKSRDYRAGLSMKYLISPRVDFTFGGGASRTDRLPDAAGVEEEDSRTIYGDTSVSYRFNPFLSSGLYVNTRHYSWDTTPDSQTYSVGLQGAYEVAQHYSLRGRAGVAHFQQDAGPTNEGTDDWTSTASFSFGYTKKYFSATLAASTEPSGGTGFGVLTDRLTVYLSLTDQFAERWRWNLSTSYQRNKSIDEPTDDQITTTTGALGISYAATKWASFRLQGDILRQRSTEGVADIDRESVFLGVEFSNTYLY